MEKWRKLGGKIGVKEWDYKAETPDVPEEVEKSEEKGEENVETPVAIAVQA